MKNLLFAMFVCGLSLGSYAQSSSVERSIFNVQTNLLGLYINNESRLTNSIALRSEIGLDAVIWGNDYYGTGYLMTPVITLEPKWYYNLSKRLEKNKRIDQNSGNFITLKTSYHPDWFLISNRENVSIINFLTVIPSWGIRRNLGTHFNYEVGAGVGIAHYFIKAEDYYSGDETVAAIDFHVRIGYTF
ncbi:hypothetical protein [Formosa sp. A9]|uniref:hypothetical protein n=1 Tax=Formosa sp. A9 TaxID=3442641 RepID=UPI003EBDC011